MKLLSIILLLAAVCAVVHAAKLPWATQPHARDGDFVPPKWYHGHDGPIYGVQETKEGDIELRSYHPSVWASTNFTKISYKDALSEGTKRLDSYWGGQNVPEERLDTTVPTFVQMEPKRDRKAVKNAWTVEYYVPNELHEAPPAPSAEDVNVIKLPDMMVWVKSFGGYASEDDVVDQVFTFFDDLDEAGIKVRQDLVGVALYDAPYHVFNRHNEIWAWPEEQQMTEEAVSEARAELRRKAEVLMDRIRGAG